MSRRLGRGLAMMFLVSLLLPVAPADDGRIPVHLSGPMTISAPGYYRLTNDLTLAAGEEILIDSDHVVLDLGTHQIVKSAGNGQVAIRVGGGVGNVLIRRGRITGSGTAVKYTTNEIVRARIRLEGLEITGTTNNGVDLEGVERVELVGCRIVDAGAYAVRASGSIAAFGGRFIGNTIIRPGLGGLVLAGLRNAELRDNLVSEHTGPGSAGIRLLEIAGIAAGGNRLIGNTIRAGGTDAGGVIIERNQVGNLVLDNVITGNGGAGIRLLSSGNHVEGNVAGGGLDHGIVLEDSHNSVLRNQIEGNRINGLLVSGMENLIDDNLLAGNRFWGIEFAAGTGNAYRNNVFRDNASGARTGPATDAGGNNY